MQPNLVHVVILLIRLPYYNGCKNLRNALNVEKKLMNQISSKIMLYNKSLINKEQNND